jgi:hypothetical protein
LSAASRNSSRRSIAPLSALGAVCALLALQPASAEDLDAVRVEVRAHIPGRCGFATPPPAEINGVRIDRAQAIALPFLIDCNEPFHVGLQSANGAVLRDGGALGGGFRSARSYEVELRVATDDGALNASSCSSTSIAAASAAPCAFALGNADGGVGSGDAIAINQPGEIIVSWPDAEQDGPRFAAGDYNDTLTIRLSRSM